MPYVGGPNFKYILLGLKIKASMKKKYAQIWATQAEALKDQQPAILGCYTSLVLLADYDGVYYSSTRKLAKLWHYGDLSIVTRTIQTLVAAGLIRAERTAAGTKFTILAADLSVLENNTECTEKQYTSVSENDTAGKKRFLTISVGEAFINKQQDKSKEKIAKKRKQPALFAEQQDPLAGTFRAELTAKATPAQTFAKWYMQTIWPDMYATAKKAAVGSWFRRYGKALNAVLDCANGDVELCKEVTLACKARRDKNTFFKGEPPSLEYIAASWAQDLRTAMNQRRAHAAEEHARQMNEAKQKAAEAERKQREQEYWDSLTPEEKEKFGQYVSDDVKKGAK